MVAKPEIRRPFTPEEDAEILAAKRPGEYRRVAEQLGRTYSAVASRAALLGVRIHQPISDADRERATAMRQAGRTLDSIAGELGVSRYRVEKILGLVGSRRESDQDYDPELCAARRRELDERKAAASAWKAATGGLLVPRNFDAVLQAHRDGTMDELARQLRRQPQLYPGRMTADCA